MVAYLSDGSIGEGVLGAWGCGWIELDGRRWDGLVFFEVVR